jgi:hypothetical protein
MVGEWVGGSNGQNSTDVHILTPGTWDYMVCGKRD